MPFISRYKLSASNPFGLGRFISGGRVTVSSFAPEIVIASSSTTRSTAELRQSGVPKNISSEHHSTNLGIFFAKPSK
jgi:hypothetical protein